MKKRLFYKINPLKYINGAKGAISLFLAVLLTPFLTIAMILVESGRYNSAVSTLDDALGVSSLSTLANYDSYLQERWGMLALSQENDIKTKFSEYLDVNSGIMGNSITVNSLSAKGEYALNDTSIMSDQILEFCKLNAPTKLATDFLDLSSFLQSFEKIKNMSKIIDLFTNASDMIDDSITFFDSTSDIKTAANKLDELKSDYDTKYDDFESAVNDLIDKLNENRPDDEEEARSYDDEITNLRENAISAQTEYSEVLQSIVDNMTTYKEKMADCSSAVSGMHEDIVGAVSNSISLEQSVGQTKNRLDEVNEEIKRLESNGFSENDSRYKQLITERANLESEAATLQTQSGVAEATKEGLSTIHDGWETASGDYNDEVFGLYISGFEDLKATVNNLHIDEIDKDTAKIEESKYKSLDVAGYIGADSIDDFISQQEDNLKNGSLSALIDGITAFFDSILNMSMIYDPKLSANINTEFYQTNFGGLPGSDSAEGGVIAIVRDIGSIVKDCAGFGTDLASLKIVSALKRIWNIIQTIIQLLSDIASFAADVANNIINLFTGYERVYYSAYTTYNLPCRTDAGASGVSFTSLAGYELTPTSLPQQNINGIKTDPFANLAALIDAITSYASGTGDDITFSGAELEYVLFGSNSEIANQLYVFCALYLFRTILDIFPVLGDPEIQSLAAASTFGYPVVMILVILAEGLADSILLVNGGDVALWKTDIYLSPSGLPGLIESLISVCKFSTDQQEQIKSKMVNAFGASDDDYDYQRTMKSWEEKKTSGGEQGDLKKGVSKYLNGLISFNYKQYCFIFLLLTVTNEQQVARISNLVQMESLYHYQQEEASFTFDLRKSYTHINAKANISVKQMLPSLIDSSLFTINRECFRGY